jgi:hypothetical protein
MARGHLFLIVVLLAAAAVAGMLAITRAAQTRPAAATDSAISFRLKRLDRLEASLEKQLTARSQASQSSPAVTYTPAPATSTIDVPVREDDEGSFEHEDGGDRDD